MLLIIVDANSKFVDAHIVSSATTSVTLTKLRQTFSFTGLPHTIVSDNGICFTNDEFEQFCRANGIKHVRCSPYHPSSNGAAERAVQTVKSGCTLCWRGTEWHLSVRQEEHLRSSCSKHRHRPALICYDHQYRTKFCINKHTTNSGMTRMLPHALSWPGIVHIDGLGHKPSNSKFSTIFSPHKMTRDQVIHQLSGSTNQNRRTRHLLKPSNSTALLDSWHNPFKSGSSTSQAYWDGRFVPDVFYRFFIVLKKKPVHTWMVCARDHRYGPWEKPMWMPTVIESQLGPLTFTVRLSDGRLWKRH